MAVTNVPRQIIPGQIIPGQISSERYSSTLIRSPNFKCSPHLQLNLRHRKVHEVFRNTLIDERGNVESALVLIPLMILFLSVAQIGLSVYSRNITGSMAQGQVAYRAIGDTSAGGSSSKVGTTSTVGTTNAGGSTSGNSDSNAPGGLFEKSVIDHNSSSMIAMPLPGGGSVLVGETTVKTPIITPLLPQGDIFKVQGIAVQE